MSIQSSRVVSVCDDCYMEDDLCDPSLVNKGDDGSMFSLIDEDDIFIFVREMEDAMSVATTDDDMSDSTESIYDMRHDLSGSFDIQFCLPCAEDVKSRNLVYNVSDVKCPLCYLRVDGGEAVVLDCKHTVCISCFQSYIMKQLENATNSMNQIVCPITQGDCCRMPVNASLVDQVLDAIPPAVPRWKESSMYHPCPTEGCANKLYWQIGNGLPIGDCFQCNRTSCLKCDVSPYHRGQTCEEHQVCLEMRNRSERFAYVVPNDGSEQRNEEDEVRAD